MKIGMSSNRRSFFKATLATGLVLLAGRANAKPKPLIQSFEYGFNTKTETVPVTFEFTTPDGKGTWTKEYRVSVDTPEPRLVIRYSDGTQAVFVGDEVGDGISVLEQVGWGKFLEEAMK